MNLTNHNKSIKWSFIASLWIMIWAAVLTFWLWALVHFPTLSPFDQFGTVVSLGLWILVFGPWAFDAGYYLASGQ
jgi:hypothetical protein